MNWVNSIMPSARVEPFWADGASSLTWQRTWRGYALALVVISLIVALKLLLDPFITFPVPFLLFTSAVLLIAWLGGLGPGLLALFLATALAAFLFVPPARTLWKPSWGDNLALLIFLLEGGFICRQAHVLRAQHEALRASEDRLRRGEERVRRLFQGAPIGIGFGTAGGRILDVNETFLELTGYTREEFFAAGITWKQLTPPEYAEIDQRMVSQMMEEGVSGPWEKEYVRKDGTRVPLLLSVARVQEQADEHVAFVLDISERKEIENRTRLLNQQLEHRVAERTRELAEANEVLSAEIRERQQTEEALREQEARLQAILASAGAVITIDEQGIIESANTGAQAMLGYAPEELVGQSISILMPAPYKDEHKNYLANYYRTGVRKVIGMIREVQAVRKDGSAFPAELAVTEVRLGARQLFTGVLRNVQARKSLEREVLEIAAREQHRLGRELHDGVGQQLTGLSLMVNALVHQMTGSAAGPRATAERIAAHLETLHEEVRALSRGLVPVHLDAEGLRAALEDLAVRTQEQTRVFCVFRCDEPVPVVDADAATHLYRIAQEAVSNALRHGRPRTIRISLRRGAAALVLAVQDDGVGIPDLAASQGLGIRIMEYRAGVIGGTVQVRPAPGGGTLVTCTLPWGKKHGST